MKPTHLRKTPINRLMITLAVVVPLVVLSVVLFAIDAQARDNTVPDATTSTCYKIWNATINVADNGGDNIDLVYGQGLYASDGKDECDELAPPKPPPGGFDARFHVDSPANDYLVDYRLADVPTTIEWEIEFQPGSGGYPFTFTWDTAALPGAGSIRLQDLYGGSLGYDVDMREQSSLIMTDDNIDTLKITYETDRCTITAVANGNWTSDATWNENCQADTPSTTDDIHIPDGVTVDFDADGTTVESLTVSGGGGVLDFTASGGTLTVSDNAFTRDNGLIDLGTAGDLNVGDELTNEGRLRETKTVDATGFTEATVTFLDIAGYGGVTITSNNTPLGSTTVTIRGGLACDTDDTAVHRCFYITPSNSTTEADITFRYASGELNGSDCSTMQAWRSTGGDTWTQAGTLVSHSCSANPYSVDYTGVTINDSRTIFDLRSGESPTAITLNAFNADSQNGMLNLALVALAAALALAAILIWRRQSRQNSV